MLKNLRVTRKKMARTKNCAHIKPKSPSSSPSPCPSPAPTHPPPPPNPHVTTPAFKSVPTAPSLPSLFSPALASTNSVPSTLPPIVDPPSKLPSALPSAVRPPQIIVERPRKKIMFPGPFIKGQVGSVYFSLDKIRSYMEIPHGYSIIVQNFHLRCKFEPCFSKYVIIDPIGNKWEAPEVFVKWCQCVESNTIQDLDLNKTRLAIVRYGNNFKLCTSVKKTTIKTKHTQFQQLSLPKKTQEKRKIPIMCLQKAPMKMMISLEKYIMVQ